MIKPNRSYAPVRIYRKIIAFIKRKWIKRILITIASLIISFLVLDALFPLKVSINYSQIIVADDGTVLHAFLNNKQKWRMYTELNEITPSLHKAFINKEDKYFYYHYGINPFAILRAAFNNIIRGRKTSGASTITMQVVRLLYPEERTYFNKMKEMFRAMQLEHHYTKDEILQMYLNLAPYGGNIEGVKAASLLYFGRLPNFLSLAQIATLTVIPNRPTSLKVGEINNVAIVKERNKWLKTFEKEKIFPKKTIEDALTEPFDFKRMEAPKMAPHYAYRLSAMYPNKAIIHTRLKKSFQDKLEHITSEYSQHLRYRGVYNSAVIIVDNKTHGVVAYVGSPNYDDKDHSGEVDGVMAIRSPGSTLKPLVYALAMDKGLLTPKSIIADVPTNFDGYNPENFNSKFNGNVMVEKALAYSLNMPAVKTLNKIGLPSLVDKLKIAGFKQIAKDEKKLGLSTVLGGCGVRLDEMAGLYCTFANGGIYSPLKWVKEDTSNYKQVLVSDGADFMITYILTQLTRPDLPNNSESSIHIPKIAWKTGTSYGRRDAWSIGYNKKYTIATWVGNFNGQGVPELTGAEMATPLLFDIFNSLDYNSDNDWFTVPKSVDFRLVCNESGLIPNEFCENSVIDYYLPGVSSTQQCEHMKEIYVSPDEKISYCVSCLPDVGYKKKLYPNYEPDLVSFYESEGIKYTHIPPHNPRCDRIFTDKPPVITSLVDNKEYLVEKADPQLQLSCNADNDVKMVYWYINNRFYKSSRANEKIFFTPMTGKIKISCSDDKGQNKDINIKVGYY